MRADAITVKDLKIVYRSLQSQSIKKSLFKAKKSKRGNFEAIKGISFSIKEGEIVGIIGKNGSGKSTLLRALANIFAPDEGSIHIHEHTISLMAIGVGFQPSLTGRENIMLSGMLLGFEEEMIRKKMNEIIEFSELGSFIDVPVKNYSSGMHSKLAFSITSVLETDIMLVDEVLSVGDARFKKKSEEKMKSLIGDKHRTVVIVSHSISTLSKLCDKVIWMHEGEIKMYDETQKVLYEYLEFMGADEK
ncbi:MAG: ABC transporter ATP-binding protein [Lachnospiraceae bacterium]|nr:ABC transporter ATP-binding protein [Lachnospiraceae bacterium]